MRNTTRLLQVLDRVENGPIVDEEHHDMTTIPETIAQLQHEFDIQMPDHRDGPIVLSDDGLADRVWEAGLRMAEILGAVCINTNRRILFSRDEINDALRVAPLQVTLGSGLDKATETKRNVDDCKPLFIKAGPIGAPIPEDIWIPAHQSYAQESLVDALESGTFESVYGREARSHSPWEILLGWHECELSKAACARAGRPGLGLGCVTNSVSEVAEISSTSYGGFSRNDWHHVAMISEFKTDYMMLMKVAHLIKTESVIHAFYNTIYGGTVGGKEGIAIAIVGGCILLQMLYMTNTHSISPSHPFFGNDTHPEVMQALSVSQQAMARNSRLLTDVVCTPVSGPGTYTLLYETAALTILASASGTCGILGPRSAAGITSGHCSGLESRFMAEVAHASAGISRKDADVLVSMLIDNYKDVLDKRPIGKDFRDIYDLVTIQPKPDWMEIYENVKKELRVMGLNI
jgi:methylamine--corrinoid protein Co-methyltransferase